MESVAQTENATQLPNLYDVIVVGGGAAGVGAAIGARQASPSARILLVESESCLGGAATHRNVVSFCGLYTLEKQPRLAVGGVWDDIYARLQRSGGVSPRPSRRRLGVFLVVEPEDLKVVLDDIVLDNGIEVLLRTTVTGATRGTSLIRSLEIQEKSRRRLLFAKAFVDCSGDCDLAYHAGASTRYGNHGTVNLGSLSARFGGLERANPVHEDWENAVIQAKKTDPSLQALCRKNRSAMLRLPRSGDVVSFLATESYDARSSASITSAEMSGRRQIQRYLQILRALPGHENMHLVSSGPSFGVRESRHLNARYSLREADVMSNARFGDAIALGAWGMEFHDEGDADWGSSFKRPPHGTFEIPLRCLRSNDTDNLFAAGRCADADQYAGSSIRVMGTALATGQAAGVAAAMYAAGGADSKLDAEAVRACLRAHGALLDASALPSLETTPDEPFSRLN
ncbi:hypothetical protein V2A60_009254 [Cordyceps javanica]|uniref:FAD dependent oxidoreductase domain-containing protein n=1 Tax=Cordyceps javanica TaxID=43265 RepID=A0A545UTK3_9HYPO|nr:FAD dependent oxidoreductase domain-containing protein [Cordyceps javanica]TQW02110.1 FAD dependent oxidoreductase domain-containing protein [Cordyceps javanica]